MYRDNSYIFGIGVQMVEQPFQNIRILFSSKNWENTNNFPVPFLL